MAMLHHGQSGRLRIVLGVETSEIYGAEHLLTLPLLSGRRLVDMIHWWEDYTAKFGATIDNNPSHGNKEGGLTTI